MPGTASFCSLSTNHLCTMASSANDELDPVYIYPNIYCY